MNENNQDEQDILKKTDENVDESTDTVESQDETQDEIDYRAEYEKAKQIAENQKIRAEKAEAKLKSGNSTRGGETFKAGELSPLDIIAVTKANLDEDSLKEVLDYAKYKKISVSEAIKAPAIKAILNDLEETKKTAAATNIGYARRGSSKVSDDALLDMGRKGILPDSESDMQRLIALRRAKK